MTNISFGFENPLKERFGEDFFKRLPRDPGVYTFVNRRGEPLYIGKADNLKNRLMSYQRAKPGQTPDHILEMIEHAHDLKFELKSSGEEALKREAELIRSVRPPYNVALNWDVGYLYVGFKAQPIANDRRRVRVEFRLSHLDVKDDLATFGCFRHRGKAKLAYSALLRLLFAAFCPRERFQLPSKICRSSPAYQYAMELPPDTLDHLENYFAGLNTDLLRYLLDALLARENFPKTLYVPMQRDLETLKDFYAHGPLDTAKLARRLRSRTGRVSQASMDRLIAREFTRSLR